MQIPIRIIIHHTGVSYKRNPDQFLANNSYHQQKWHSKSSLGFYLYYTYEINERGYVRQARALGERTAVSYNNNFNNGKYIHIALDGNFEMERPAPNEIYALRDLLRILSARFNIKREAVYFHKQFSNTKCPGRNMDLNFIRSLI